MNKQIWTYITGGGLIAVLSLALWGIPHYIDNRVGSAVASEIEAREALQGKSQDVQSLETQNATIIAQLGALQDDIGEVKTDVRDVRNKQSEFGQVFMDYLARE